MEGVGFWSSFFYNEMSKNENHKIGFFIFLHIGGLRGTKINFLSRKKNVLNSNTIGLSLHSCSTSTQYYKLSIIHI